jgi:hypothetical protein
MCRSGTAPTRGEKQGLAAPRSADPPAACCVCETDVTGTRSAASRLVSSTVACARQPTSHHSTAPHSCSPVRIALTLDLLGCAGLAEAGSAPTSAIDNPPKVVVYFNSILHRYRPTRWLSTAGLGNTAEPTAVRYMYADEEKQPRCRSASVSRRLRRLRAGATRVR